MKRICVFDGCEKFRVSHGYCATHWERIRRHGDPSVVKRRQPSGRPSRTKGGYLLEQNKDHPLAGKSGQVLIHRRVLWDQIGPGSHPCHACGAAVTWGQPRPARLEVDHLDGDRTNNDLSNLAVTCHICNDGQAERRKTHCVHGHEFTPENIYWYLGGPRPSRRCRECMRERDRLRGRRRG